MLHLHGQGRVTNHSPTRSKFRPRGILFPEFVKFQMVKTEIALCAFPLSTETSQNLEFLNISIRKSIFNFTKLAILVSAQL